MKTIKLRAMEPQDIEAIYRWENDPAVWRDSAAHQPFSRQTLETFINEQHDTDIYISRQLRLMADNGEGTAVGCVDLFDFDPYHHRAALGLLVDSRQRGNGYGAAIIGELEAFCRTHLQLHQLYCIIAVDNEHCCRLFEHAGFSCDGTLQDWIWNSGQWVDAHLYQKIIA